MPSIRQVQSLSAPDLEQLAALLVTVVDDGASVGFLPPMEMEEARRFWRGVGNDLALSDGGYGGTLLWVAEVDGRIAGTVQLHLVAGPNGRHRAEVAKLLVHPEARRQGVGRALMLQAERAAVQRGRSLLVLDTIADAPSNLLYRSMGWQEAGRIPSFARSGAGDLETTVVYYRLLAGAGPGGAAVERSGPAVRRYVDLSHRIEPGMPSYPGLPAPQLGVHLSHLQSAGHYAPGTTFQIATYAIGGNTGTYVDAPFHRHPGGADLATVPLDRLADLPGVVVDAPEEGPVDVASFERAGWTLLRGAAVLVRTGWSRRWGSDGYFRSGPYLTGAACRALADAGAALLGIDCANIDNMDDPTRPAHTILLAAGIPIVEHLCHLDRLPVRGFRFSAVPPAIAGGTSFPVRAYALLP